MSQPSCPRCGFPNDVADMGYAHRSGRFHCAHCNLVFVGSDEEWGQWTNRRAVVQKKELRPI